MKKKTKQDFQEMIKAEHCEHGSVSVITPWLPQPHCPTSGLSHSLGAPVHVGVGVEVLSRVKPRPCRADTRPGRQPSITSLPLPTGFRQGG